MNMQIKPIWRSLLLSLLLIILTTLPALTQVNPTGLVTRRVNVPYTPDLTNISVNERALFWFGQVGPTDSNYTDVRTIYNDEILYLTVHIFDRLLFYDTTPTPADLTNWDAATLYLKLDGNTGQTPTTQAYQFVGQWNFNEPRPSYEAVYRGNGSGWSVASTSFTTSDGWQGNGINDTAEDRGWNLTFAIPFASLGFSGPPTPGTIWGLGLVVHDRDTANGTPAIPNQKWPESLQGNQPSTWGQLRFGLPGYTPPSATPGGTVVVRQGLNGATVPDGQVGGDSVCANPIYPNFWALWGSLNYSQPPESERMVIQNQWNLGDWPCFAKYYVTFPLDGFPTGMVILSATLTLTQFGNSDPTQAQPSLIQVFTVAEDWSEATLTWNNAPLAVENVSRAWVDPLGPPWTQTARQWDVTLAVAQAYGAGQPLRLALYTAANEMHSGKYFRASNVPDPTVRPTLSITWGYPNQPPTHFLYLPIIQ